METPDLLFALKLPPEEIIKQFRDKGYTFSWDWHDVQKEAHAKAFTVAKVMKLDILQDIRAAVDKSISEGITFEQFKKELAPKLKAKGWWGKVPAAQVPTDPNITPLPEGNYQLGSVYRLKTIFQTNTQVAYMAGRWKALKENSGSRPWFEWVAVLDRKTRATHKAMNGKIFRYDDPIWETFSPPIDWRCRCRLRSRSEADVKNLGLKTSDSSRDYSLQDRWLDPKNEALGKVKVGVYKGGKTTVETGRGWAYNKGEAAFNPDFEKYDYKVLRKYVQGVLTGPEFLNTYSDLENAVLNSDRSGLTNDQLREKLRIDFVKKKNFPVAVLNDEYKKLLGTNKQTVFLSDETLLKQIISREGQSFSAADYKKVQNVIEAAELIIRENDENHLFIRKDEKLFYAVVKTTKDKEFTFLTSFRETNPANVLRKMKIGKIIRDDLKL